MTQTTIDGINLSTTDIDIVMTWSRGNVEAGNVFVWDIPLVSRLKTLIVFERSRNKNEYTIVFEGPSAIMSELFSFSI